MLQVKLAKLKKVEVGARAELAAMQTGNEDKTANTRLSSANTRDKSDKAAEEDQDKQRISDLLNQLEINNEEIYKNKIEIREIKEAIMQAVGAGLGEMVSDDDVEELMGV